MAKSDDSTFMLEQFKALRHEIMFHLDYSIKITAAGIFFLPAGFGIAKQFDVSYLIAGFPLAVIALLLLVWHHHSTVMVIGRYIRFYIEPYLMQKTPGVDGYEHYLETDKGGRLPETLYAYVVSLIFLIYYVIAAIFSHPVLVKELGAEWATVISGSFAVLFVAIFVLQLGLFPKGTGDVAAIARNTAKLDLAIKRTSTWPRRLARRKR